ncbi:MAG: methyltransferase domain-containing protein [Sedimentisphaerales bacterium]|nr:methyltransferase domain-containing protein [Sedimentisphaerales bacterium]
MLWARRIESRHKLRRKISSVLPSSWRWTLGALTEKAAVYTTIHTKSIELYDKQGMQLAEELKAKIPPGSTVLDFGCGMGRPEKFLSSYCKEIYGVDISGGMLRLARKRHKNVQNVHFVKCGKTDLSVLQDCTFDFVFSEAVLQHMVKEHVVRILKELHRICKSNGKVYLQFCNLLCPYNLDSFIKYSLGSKILTSIRMRYWLPQEVQQVVKALGFEIINLEIKSDSRDENRDCQLDDYRRDYSIWVFASKK